MRLTYRFMDTDPKVAGPVAQIDRRADADEKRTLIARIRAPHWPRHSRRRRGLSEVHRVRLTAHNGPAW